MTTTTEQLTNRCQICGGSAGAPRIPAAGHHLCQALQSRGMPTPSLGERCEACGGSGHQRREMPRGIALPMLPTGREINLWFPKCEACGGSGSIKK